MKCWNHQLNTDVVADRISIDKMIALIIITENSVIRRVMLHSKGFDRQPKVEVSACLQRPFCNVLKKIPAFCIVSSQEAKHKNIKHKWEKASKFQMANTSIISSNKESIKQI